jgi:hypothetical protein
MSLCWALLFVITAGSHDQGADMNDPYKIMEKHFEATGGLNKILGIKTVYKEAALTIAGTDLKGTVKQWERVPRMWRQDVDLGVIRTCAGDNGEIRWSVDPNGKIQIHRDKATLQDRELKRLMGLLEYRDPQSQHFKLAFEGVSKVNDEDCYAVAIVNTVSSTTQINYYSTATFCLIKMVLKKPNSEETTFFSDFRTIDGLILPFKEVTETAPAGEKQIMEYSTYENNIPLEGISFDPPVQDVKDYRFASGSSAPDIPFQLIENHIYLPITINNKEQLWVLDCGAAVTVVDSGYAAGLGFSFEGPIKGQGAAGPVNLFYVTLPAYEMNGIEFGAQKVLSMNIRDIFKPILGLEIAGILGYDFLSRFVTRIDYAREKISLYDPEFFDYTGTGEIIDSPLQDRMFSLPMTVDSVYAGQWRLDIGSASIDFQYPFARDHGLLDRTGIDLVAIGAGGSQTIRVSKFSTVEIAGCTFLNPLIGIPQDEGAGAFSHSTVIGNVGNVLLRNFVLYLDYAQQRLILEPGDDFGKSFPEDKSGLHLQYSKDDRIMIAYITPGTPAADAGFQKGDIVTKINGKSAADYGMILDLRKLFKEKAGLRYKFTILRGDETLELELTLRDLF